MWLESWYSSKSIGSILAVASWGRVGLFSSQTASLHFMYILFYSFQCRIISWSWDEVCTVILSWGGNFSTWPSIATLSSVLWCESWCGCWGPGLSAGVLGALSSSVNAVYLRIRNREGGCGKFGPVYCTCAVIALKTLRTICRCLFLTFSLPLLVWTHQVTVVFLLMRLLGF